MPQASCPERERLINAIMANVSTTAALLAKVESEDSDAAKRKELEADTQRWVAVGQAAATKLFETLKDKGLTDEVPNEGALLTRMNIPLERLQWSNDDEMFY